MLNSGPRDGGRGVGSGAGVEGGVQLECLVFSSSHACCVNDIVGGNTALPNIPNLVRVTAEYRDCLMSAWELTLSFPLTATIHI